MKLISVVIPVYNVEIYLEECLRSILNQTYKDLEIIIVDDGSTDSSSLICDKYERKDNRVVVVHKENGGLSSARNAGVKIASGEYITFIDSDDYVTEDYIEQLVSVIEKDGSDISCLLSTSDEKELYCEINCCSKVLLPKEAIRMLLEDKGLHTSTWGKLYKINLFSDITFPDGKIYEDYATTYLLFGKSKSISLIDVKKYYYRDNFQGITKSAFSEKNMQYFEIAKGVNKNLEKMYPDLVKYAKARDVNMALGLYRKICRSNYHNLDVENELLGYIKNGLAFFLYSGYPILKKIVAIIISIMPIFARRLMR